MSRRVVITGLGALTPLGTNVPETWTALLEGRSGIGPITKFDASNLNTQIAAEIPDDWSIADVVDPKQARRMDKYTQYAHFATNEAFKDAGLKKDDFDPEKAGIILGTGIGGIGTFENQLEVFLERGPRRVSPFFITMMISDIAAGQLAIEYGFKGINYTTTSACASAGHAIGSAFDAIRLGRADICITGGAEAPIIPISIAGFCANRAMTVRNNEPLKASRPFDKDRDGFVMGEGSGILIVEELEHALQRGAKIYAELLSYSATADAFHITAPPEDGDGAYRVMKNALNEASLEPEQVDYINAHGTSTPVGDISECVAVKRLFGENGPLISSTKGAMGHLLGAAAAVEAIVAIKAIQDNKIPPTMNLDNIDEKCVGVNHLMEIIDKEVNISMSNSFGFGGHNSTLVFKRFQE